VGGVVDMRWVRMRASGDGWTRSTGSRSRLGASPERLTRVPGRRRLVSTAGGPAHRGPNTESSTRPHVPVGVGKNSRSGTDRPIVPVG